MTITISPTKLSGPVTPPPSKSQAHRVLIAAALAHGESVIHNLAPSQDIAATRRCLTELGAEFADLPGGVRVRGMAANAMSPLRRMAPPRLDCGESGSTLRFLIPVALALRGGGVFTGRGRLMDRPLKPYFDLFAEKGIFYEQKDGVLTLQGLLPPGEYKLPGNVSSQFFTGLLYALPLLGGPSVIFPTTPIESEGYIAMTTQAMAAFGVPAAATLSLPPQYHLAGNQTYRPAEVTVEADWSQAAFWFAAMTLGNKVEPQGLDMASLQGDKAILEFTRQLMCQKAVEFDVSQCPDLVPPMALAAALRPGTVTCLTNAQRLRAKESDRLSAVAQELTKLGAQVTEGPASLTIEGVSALHGGEVDAHNDHRIAMMLAIAATRCQAPVVLHGAESVNKSYPNFWEHYQQLGGSLL